MLMETLAGAREFRPRLDQKMLLNGVVMRTDPAYAGGSLRLETARLAVDLSPEQVSIETPDRKMPFTLEGRIGGGELSIKGRGLSGRIPPLDLEEKNGKAGEASAGRDFFRITFLQEIDGRWRGDLLSPKPRLVKFTCRGNMVVEKPGGAPHQRVTLEDTVRITGNEGDRQMRLAADTLALHLLPATGPGDARRRSRIGSVLARGDRVLLASAQGEILAEEISVRLTAAGKLRRLSTKKLKRISGKTPAGKDFQALGFTALAVSGYTGRPFPGAPICPELLFSGRLPGYLVRLHGSGRLKLGDEKEKPLTLRVKQGLDLLCNREQRPLRAAASGPVTLEAPELDAYSDRGFLAALPTLVPGPARLDLTPPGGGPPVSFTVRDRGGRSGSFFLAGRGRASLTTGRWTGGEEDLGVNARACGPRAFLRAESVSPTETVEIRHIARIELTRRRNHSHLAAFAGPLQRIALNTRKRLLHAWGESLDLDYDHAAGRGTARFQGRPGEPVLVITRPEHRPEEKETQALIHLLSPRLIADLAGGSGKEARLRTEGGFQLRTDAPALAGEGHEAPALAIPEAPGPERPATLQVSGGLFRLERERADGPEVVRMFDRIKLFGFHPQGTAQGSGKYLWISPSRRHAILLGGPADIRLHRRDGSGRTMRIVSEVLDFTPDKIVAGELAAGIGGQVEIASSRDYLGRKTEGKGVIQAACGMPIQIRRDRLEFTGITTMNQAHRGTDGTLRPAPSSPVLVCGRMVCHFRREGPAVFDRLVAGDGFRVKLQRREKETLMGKGGELSFFLDRGLLLMDGTDTPCEMMLGEHLTRGSRIAFDLDDYTWRVQRFRCQRRAGDRRENGESPAAP